jgi:hypothetical protein
LAQAVKRLPSKFKPQYCQEEGELFVHLVAEHIDIQESYLGKSGMLAQWPCLLIPQEHQKKGGHRAGESSAGRKMQLKGQMPPQECFAFKDPSNTDSTGRRNSRGETSSAKEYVKGHITPLLEEVRNSKRQIIKSVREEKFLCHFRENKAIEKNELIHSTVIF